MTEQSIEAYDLYTLINLRDTLFSLTGSQLIQSVGVLYGSRQTEEEISDNMQGYMPVQ